MVSLHSKRAELAPEYKMTLEATHHGPTSLGSSVLFVELGSTEKEWIDWNTAGFIADSVMAAIESRKKYDRCGVGLGGTHYPDKLTKIVTESKETCLGPIVPKYALEFFNSELLDQILTKGDQKVDMAIVDMKGLGKFKESVLKVLNHSHLEIVPT